MEAPRRRSDSLHTMAVLIGEWGAVPPDEDVVGERGRIVRRAPTDARVVRDLVSRLDPDWLLIGARVDDPTIRTIVQAAREIDAGLAIAMLGHRSDLRRCSRWMRRGCQVYMDQDASLQRTLHAMEVAAAQRIIVIDRVFHDAALAQQVPPVGSLTRREEEVLQLLCLGLRNSDIAQSLHLTENTVEFHVSRLLAKLGVRNRVEAADRANVLGLA